MQLFTASPFCYHSRCAFLPDTEGSFMAERADDIAAAFLQHLQRMVKHCNSAEKQASVGRLMFWES